MQIQKTDIRHTILKAAREEFLDKGFKDTSMRTIAEKAEVSLSNIYNYFKNKDEIFREVLSEVLEAFDRSIEEHNSAESISIKIFHSEKHQRSHVDLFLNLSKDYKKELLLLFFKSSGSSLEHFKEELIERYTTTGMEYIQLMKEKYPELNANISSFFIHTISAWNVGGIMELIMHDLDDEQLEQYIQEHMAFSTAGWKKLMGVDKDNP